MFASRPVERCQHCYAEAFSKRIGLTIWGVNADRRLFGDKHWAEPAKWHAKAVAEGRRLRVFCASMADWLEDRRDLDDQRDRLFDLIESTPSIDWLMLTKRPENFATLARASWRAACPPHVQFGFTAENQEYWDKRSRIALDVPAHIRFCSMEPMLEPIDLRMGHAEALWDGSYESTSAKILRADRLRAGIHQIIIGGESGAGARRFDLSWARSIISQCKAARVAAFYKQGGTSNRCVHDAKGGCQDCMPADLRVREFPA